MNGLVYASRGSFGLSVNRGVTEPEEITSLKLDPKTNICRSLKFSNNGQYLCYCDSARTVVIETSTGEELFAIDYSKTQQIEFSTRDTVMATYEPYVVYGSRMNADGTMKVPRPNLNFWSLKLPRSASQSERHLAEFNAKKQSAWRPQFSEDESKAVRLSEKGVFIYENLNFHSGRNVAIKDLESFAVSPGATPHMMCFIPGLKGQPALLQLRELSGDLQILYQKHSFNCDKCTMTWNSKGNAVLVTATVDVDKSDKSYYGVSHMFCISTKMDCFQVDLDKAGPLHYVEWSPTGNQFCVCYGFMPSKVRIFSVKGETLWDIGEGHRNEVHYSPFGDILVTCGFGNISSGKMNFWNVETKKEIIQHEAPLTTHFEWAPDGKHFVTATTAPRLRTSNGYRIWNYVQGVIHYKPQDKEELWQVTWRPSRAFSKPDIAQLTSEQLAHLSRNQISGGIKTPLDHLPPDAITKSGVYVPPAMRKKGAPNAIRQNVAPAAPARPALSEAEKKIKNLQKKLDDIVKLKEKVSAGVVLEINQQEKIRGEAALRTELEKLRLQA